MKVLITNFHVRNDGGHKTYINALLKSNNIDYHVACPSSSDTYQSLITYKNLINVDFPSKPKEIKAIIKSFTFLKNYITNNNIEIIHANGSPDHRMAIYLKYWFKFFLNKKIKVIYTKHNSYSTNGIVSKWRINKLSDAIIFVCEDAYRKAGSPKNINKFIIENGVDIDYWKAPIIPHHDDTINIVSIAGISEYKRWDVILDALNLLDNDTAKRFSVTIVGGIPHKHKTFINNAKEKGYQLQFIDKTLDPKKHLKNKDVGFVLSDKTETISFACREMMAYGIPVIVSDFSGLPDNITDYNDGWITEKGNAHSVKNILVYLAKLNKNELLKYKFNAQAKAKNAFSIEKMINDTEIAVSSVLN